MLAYIHTDKRYDEELLNTIADMVDMFDIEYELTERTNELREILEHIERKFLIGRYIADRYYTGNPQVLTTSALASILLSIDIGEMDESKVSDRFYKIFGETNDEIRKVGCRILEDLM
jgi:homoserine acetyltransferase